MKYPKTTVSLVVLLALAAWVVVSGIEGDRAAAKLAPVSTQPGVGAVLVIGGTRGTGLEVARILRARGDEVVILARPAADATAAEKFGARVARGDAMNPADLTAALASTHFRAVVSTLGGRPADSVRPDFEGNRNAADAAKAAGVQRFVMVTVIGAGASHDSLPWLSRRMFTELIAEKTRAEEYVEASGLEYTIIRPGGLLTKEAQNKAYLTEDTRSMSWIRRADLARLIVQALDDPRAINKVYHAFDPERTRFWSIPMN